MTNDELTTLRIENLAYGVTAHNLRAKVERLEAENERLREALDSIETLPVDWTLDTDANAEMFRSIARKALAETERTRNYSHITIRRNEDDIFY